MMVRIGEDGGDPVLLAGGAPLTARIDARIRRAAQGAIGQKLQAHFRDGDVCDQLMTVPVSRMKQPRWWAIWTAQVIGLFLTATAVIGIAIWPAIQGSLEALGQ